MIVIPNFLSKNTCDYLISFFENNKSKTKVFKKRLIIDLQNPEINDEKITDILNLYKKIHPTKKLKNIELISWDLGESHPWHDDTIYYNQTTITYLNADYGGGRTQIREYWVEPEIGKMVSFDATLKHQVTELLNGKRFVILAWFING